MKYILFYKYIFKIKLQSKAQIIKYIKNIYVFKRAQKNNQKKAKM